jgi:transcriptional regulator with XRE-family HTH domain
MARPISLAEPWGELARRLGGVAQLAERCGVSTRTVQRWARGRQPTSALMRDAVSQVFTRRGMSSPWST